MSQRFYITTRQLHSPYCLWMKLPAGPRDYEQSAVISCRYFVCVERLAFSSRASCPSIAIVLGGVAN